MILADSSAWILIESRQLDLGEVMGEDDLALCPPVMQELLQGAGDMQRFRKLRSLLLRSTMLDEMVPLERYEQAAELYLRCRDEAFTIRKSNDCLIAAIAIAHDVQLLHDDRDFDFLAEVSPLKAVRV